MPVSAALLQTVLEVSFLGMQLSHFLRVLLPCHTTLLEVQVGYTMHWLASLLALCTAAHAEERRAQYAHLGSLGMMSGFSMQWVYRRVLHHGYHI